MDSRGRSLRQSAHPGVQIRPPPINGRYDPPHLPVQAPQLRSDAHLQKVCRQQLYWQAGVSEADGRSQSIDTGADPAVQGGIERAGATVLGAGGADQSREEQRRGGDGRRWGWAGKYGREREGGDQDDGRGGPRLQIGRCRRAGGHGHGQRRWRWRCSQRPPAQSPVAPSADQLQARQRQPGRRGGPGPPRRWVPLQGRPRWQPGQRPPHGGAAAAAAAVAAEPPPIGDDGGQRGQQQDGRQHEQRQQFVGGGHGRSGVGRCQQRAGADGPDGFG